MIPALRRLPSKVVFLAAPAALDQLWIDTTDVVGPSHASAARAMRSSNPLTVDYYPIANHPTVMVGTQIV